MEFSIPDMSCGHCVKAITQALHLFDPVATLNINLPTRTITVQTTQDRQAIATALTEAGYPTC